jgi:predicted transport protein
VSSIEQQIANQLANIEKSTGRSLAEWSELIRASGLEKHGQIVGWLKSEHGITHGNANLLAVKVREAAAGGAPADEELVDSHYSGRNAALRPLYERVVAEVNGFGSDVELAPKKTYVSLRRKKQFATVGPAAGQLEVCLNLAGKPATDRLKPTTGMATHKVRITDAAGLDEELRGWLREAYERAG